MERGCRVYNSLQGHFRRCGGHILDWNKVREIIRALRNALCVLHFSVLTSPKGYPTRFWGDRVSVIAFTDGPTQPRLCIISVPFWKRHAGNICSPLLSGSCIHRSIKRTFISSLQKTRSPSQPFVHITFIDLTFAKCASGGKLRTHTVVDTNIISQTR